MDQGAEPDIVSPHAHAAALRAKLVAAVTAAITDVVVRDQAADPAQPTWEIDHRPGAVALAASVDAVLDDILEVVVVRRLEGHFVSFPSRIALAQHG